MNPFDYGPDGPEETGRYGMPRISGILRMQPEELWKPDHMQHSASPGDGERARRYMNERLVKTVQDCAAACEHMTMHLMSLPDGRQRGKQATLLRDCADICFMTARILARNGKMNKQVMGLCAKVCKSCGNECA